VKPQFGPHDAFPVIGHIQERRTLQKNTLREVLQHCLHFLQRPDARRAHVVGIVAAASILGAVVPDPLFRDKQTGVELEAKVESQYPRLFLHQLHIHH
jgi:hypothetical protein